MYVCVHQEVPKDDEGPICAFIHAYIHTYTHSYIHTYIHMSTRGGRSWFQNPLQGFSTSQANQTPLHPNPTSTQANSTSAPHWHTTLTTRTVVSTRTTKILTTQGELHSAELLVDSPGDVVHRGCHARPSEEEEEEEEEVDVCVCVS